ncbi:glycosyltransferase, partial [Candidatus Woesearchaeota archaeon]|nr:glycosyltransferase [Candidatus Woesearchaeota archaeon]
DNDAIELIYSESRRMKKELQDKEGFKARNFLYVGRLSREKNVQTLIRVFSQIKKMKMNNSSDWGLIIVGDGDETQYLERLSRELDVSDVFFIKGKQWKEVIKYYAVSNVLVLPSISELWGLVVNEAMICQLPVVVSRNCGSSYDLVREGENGFVFDPYNMDELEKIMLKFIDNEIDTAKMGERSKEIIKQYNPKHAAEQMLNGINFVLRTRG